MIIIFSSDAYENITMFGDVAEHLIKIMGYDVNAGVIKYENINDALSSLKNGIDATTIAAPNFAKEQRNDDDNEKPISLAHRAIPLIEMLDAAKKEKCDVTWKVN